MKRFKKKLDRGGTTSIINQNTRRGNLMRKEILGNLRSAAIGFFVLVPMIFFPGVARPEYPDRPVTVIVGMEAGGTTDVIVRAMAPGVNKALGQSVVVENKGGGGGTVALAVIA